MSGLLVPYDSAVPLALCPVEDSATAISDLLGGVLLDDARVLPLADGTAVTIYQGEDRASLPVNDRLTVLATRLGIVACPPPPSRPPQLSDPRTGGRPAPWPSKPDLVKTQRWAC